jgi:PhnB protein
MKIQPYLFFNGRADEAIAFYGQTLGAQVTNLMRFKEHKESIESGSVPADFADKVMHAHLKAGELEFMVSDGMSKEKQNFQGVSLTISVDTDAEAERIFKSLSENGQIQMPMDKTFFASRFGMLADKFGVSWMVMSGPAEA